MPAPGTVAPLSPEAHAAVQAAFRPLPPDVMAALGIWPGPGYSPDPPFAPLACGCGGDGRIRCEDSTPCRCGR